MAKSKMGNKIVSSMSIRQDLKERAERAIEAGKFPGISSVSGLIEYALEKVLKEVNEEAGS